MRELSSDKQVLLRVLIHNEDFKLLLEQIELMKKEYEEVVVYGDKDSNKMLLYAGKAQAMRDLLTRINKIKNKEFVGNTKE